MHLQPLVQETSAFLKDNKSVLQLLQGCSVYECTVKATADVASLYTGINHDGAKQAVEWALTKNVKLNNTHKRFLPKKLRFLSQSKLFLV